MQGSTGYNYEILDMLRDQEDWKYVANLAACPVASKQVHVSNFPPE